MEVVPPRNQFRASDLPLSTAKRSSIDGLLHTFKKNGGFDSARKRVWAEFVEDDIKTKFTTSLTDLAESELERDPDLLSRDRGKAATLIEGAVDRSDIYRLVEHDMDAFISKHLTVVEQTLRDLRKGDVGEEVAASERMTGMKSDEDYAREAERRRSIRESQKLAEMEKQRKIEQAALRAKEAEEKEKERQKEMQREKELQREIEMLREKEAQREKELQRQKAMQREREVRREKELEERRAAERERERLLYEDRQRMHERDESQRLGYSRPIEGQRGLMREFSERSPKPSVKYAQGENSRTEEVQMTHEEEKDWEQEALQLLLKEGQEHAAKAQQRPELERSESLEPPPRKGQSMRGSRAESTVRKSPKRSNSKIVKTRAPSPPKRPLSPDLDDQTSAPDHHRIRSRQRSRDRHADREWSRHHQDQRRSTSRSRPSYTTRWGDDGHAHSKESREAYKQEPFIEHKREGRAYERDRQSRHRVAPQTETTRRSTSGFENSTRIRDGFNGGDPGWRSHDRRNRDIARHRSRSPSPRQSRRGRSRSRSPHRRVHKDHLPRRRYDSRSSSPSNKHSYRSRPRGGQKGGQSRSPSPTRRRHRSPGHDRGDRPRPTDIDRYMPG